VDDQLQRLNPEQLRAATAGDGPWLVLAGAGSGKTRVLTTRIAHLIRAHGVPPHRILAFTFTNKAAREMRSRVEAMLGGAEARHCWLGTFHATGVRILRREAVQLGWDHNFAIYDTDDTERLIKELLQGRTMARHVSPAEARSVISGWKNGRETPESAHRAAGGDPRDRLLAEIYADYQKALRRNNAFDFDDLIARPVDLFEAEPEVLRSYAMRFLHVLVDEFQDTNTIQMLFIEMLASCHGNLFVVGDDDQSIYGWRGARIENILEFETRFRETQVVRLEQNYRSTAPILEAANHLIAHNRGRKGKNLWTARAGGEPIRLSFHADEEEEGLRAVEIVARATSAGRPRSAVAVLYRTNAQSRALEDALRRANVPYQIVGGTRFYERREVRDVIAYLKAIHNPADAVALTRILNVPRRGIGDQTVERLEAAAAAHGWTLGATVERAEETDIGRPAARKVAAFGQLLVALRGVAEHGTCVEVVQAVLERTNYFAYLRESDPATWEQRRENVEELVSAAQSFADESADDASLRAFLEEISLLSDIDSMKNQTDTVTLMTLHSAKGLEFPVVLVTGLEEGLLPHASSLDELAGLEEERRLFYVGMTRAQDELYLLAAANRRRYGDYQPMMQSRFLGELPEAGVVVEEGGAARLAARRATWAPRQPSWRSYAEGDPDTFWAGQRLDPGVGEGGLGALAPEAPRGRGRTARGKRLPQPSGAAGRNPDATHAPTSTAAPGPSLGWADGEDSQEHVALAVGVRVRHEKFGEGQVTRIEGHGDMMKITVVFGRSEPRKFVARYARLVPVR
jgi:DNA helicase-2/ATP-dependent DNA helicase PcrA